MPQGTPLQTSLGYPNRVVSKSFGRLKTNQKTEQQKKCINKTGECIFLSASLGRVLTKEQNQQGWSQKGSKCVTSFKHWDSSFENKSFLLWIRERFRAISVRYKSALISFFCRCYLQTNWWKEGIRGKEQELHCHFPTLNECHQLCPTHKTLPVKWGCLFGVSSLESYYEKIIQKIQLN